MGARFPVTLTNSASNSQARLREKPIFTTKDAKTTKFPSFILPRDAGEERGGAPWPVNYPASHRAGLGAAQSE
jgi:hypothetical protein